MAFATEIMKYFRIYLQPKSKLYFNVYILSNYQTMCSFVRKKLKLDYTPKYQAVCDRNIQNNRIGQLFFNRDCISNEQIDHELIHIIVAYLRYGHLTNQAKIDKLLQWETGREEEIAYTFPYIKQKINIKLSASPSLALAKKSRKKFIDGKNFYKWDLKLKNTNEKI